MGHGTLKLNFFPVRFTEASLPFVLRDKAPEDSLLATERGWVKVPSDASSRHPLPASQRLPLTTALAVGSRDPTHDYRTEMVPWAEAPPSAVKSLITRGLADELAKKNLDIEIDPVGFHCFERLPLQIPQGAPVTLNKGVHFKVDHIVAAGIRTYGFFVAPATRLNITPDIAQDEVLGRAAQGERVEYEFEGHVFRGTLQSIDGSSAFVLGDNQEYPVAANSIRVIPTAGTISRYFELKGRPEAARAVRLAPQISQHRLLPNGQRNRSWLRDQFQSAISWLVSHSDYSRLLFRWPHSDIEVALDTRPLSVGEGFLP